MVTHSYKKILQSIRGKFSFQQLERREKLFLGIGTAFLLCFFLIQLVIVPYLDTRKRLTRSLTDKRSNLAKIMDMQKEYFRLKSQAGGTYNRLSERAPGFTLFSFVEEQATIAKVKQQIQYMKPSTSDKEGGEHESAVELKLQKVSLAKLVGFLKLIESSENMVFIKHISIQESGANDNLLDIVIQIVTPV
jgi:general secretion pathway protein M